MKAKNRKVTQKCDRCQRPASPLRLVEGEWVCALCASKPKEVK